MTTPRHTLSTAPPPTRRLLRAPALRSRSVRGDAAAFAALYQRQHQELYRYCRAILRDDEDAQDALQSAMAKAFAALQHEGRDFELRPWLFRIAHNEAISVLRRRPDAAHLDAVPEPSVDSLPGTVADRQRLAELRADLADLPERQRSALVLRELSGLGHEEIAQVLSSSARAVKQAIFEARSGLAECAEGREMACEAVQHALSDRDGRVLRGRRIRAHLRGCRACRRFRAAMETRPADLQALASPLPVGAGAAVLAAVLPGGSATTVAGGTGTAAGSGAFAAGASSGGAAAVGGAATAGSATAGGVLAGAGSSVAGGALAGATSSVAGGAFAGLAAKAAIVAAVGAAAVGAATLSASPSGPNPAAGTPAARSTATPVRVAPAPLPAATAARGSGTPAAAHVPATGRAASPGRAHHAKTTRASRRGRAAAAPGHQRGAPARDHHGSAHGPKPGHGARAGKAKHSARPSHAAPPAHPAHPARAGPPAGRVRMPRAAAVPRPRTLRPTASSPSRRPAKRASPARRVTAPGQARPAAAAPTPAPANPVRGTSPPGHAK